MDQDILKHYPRKFGDEEIKKIIRMSKEYDVVNIQLEWGTLGSRPWSIVRRFSMLMKGCDKILLTLHTPVYLNFGSEKIRALLVGKKPVSAVGAVVGNILS